MVVRMSPPADSEMIQKHPELRLIARVVAKTVAFERRPERLTRERYVRDDTREIQSSPSIFTT